MGPRRLIAVLALVAGCGGDDGGTTTPGTWQLLGEAQPSALLSAWSSGSDDVWLVGGREGAGNPPIAWHFDGTAWNRMDTTASVDLWQVFGFRDDAVFIGGDAGTILRYRGGTFEPLTTPGSGGPVFGLWGTAPDDMWAVGGQAGGGAFVWHFDGTAFTAVPGVPTELVDGGAVWKVVGRSADDVYMTGSRGYILHWDGQTLSGTQSGKPEETLFSLGCSPERCVAAGANAAFGVLYELQNDGSWKPGTLPNNPPQLRGVTPVADELYTVGQFGRVLHRPGGSWQDEQHDLTIETLHAAWANDDGTLFVVGGNFGRSPTVNGVAIVKSADVLPPLP